MERPSRRNSRAPTCSSSWRIRVVTLDCTRLSLAAARLTPPSSTTARKIFRDSRSIVLILRMISQNYSFVQVAAASLTPAHESRLRYPDDLTRTLHRGRMLRWDQCACGGNGDRALR